MENTKALLQIHHYIFENVIDSLKGRTNATTNAMEGLKVVDIIERIYALRKLNKLQPAPVH
jgi:UDP-N-acetyl-2-amino-2-deoxyglucuronate dehydrogenase